jgi:hypothetical protein
MGYGLDFLRAGSVDRSRQELTDAERAHLAALLGAARPVSGREE